MKISIDKIVVSKDNPRQSFGEEGLRRLGESIKEHGQLQPVIVRPRASGYELVVGERRLRACALIGLSEIEADVKNVDDVTAMELRLVENILREDLTDAEKGDGVLALWANYDKYETIKDVANAIHKPCQTVEGWVRQSRKLSPKVREYGVSHILENEHVHQLVKYPHSIQDRLAAVIIRKKISASVPGPLRPFVKMYDADPEADLDELANKALGIETITLSKSELPPRVLENIEEKKQLAKVQKIRNKRGKSITKDQIRQNLEKKADFKFVKATVSHGKAGLLPPLKMEVKPTILPNPDNPDYTLCKCALCPLFAIHCKGRCWT